MNVVNPVNELAKRSAACWNGGNAKKFSIIPQIPLFTSWLRQNGGLPEIEIEHKTNELTYNLNYKWDFSHFLSTIRNFLPKNCCIWTLFTMANKVNDFNSRDIVQRTTVQSRHRHWNAENSCARRFYLHWSFICSFIYLNFGGIYSFRHGLATIAVTESMIFIMNGKR